MKSWFPFNDYDFYAYITAGVILIAGIDYTLAGSLLINKADWRIVDGVFWLAASYLVGHVAAGFAQPILQDFLVHKMLKSPMLVLLADEPLRLRERACRYCFARDYRPLPAVRRALIRNKVGILAPRKDQSSHSSDEFYHVIFSAVVYNPNSNTRMDQFLNLYGLCRNTSFSFAVSAGLLLWRALSTQQPNDWLLLLAATTMSTLLFGRFLKFYSAYTREMVRSFGEHKPHETPQ